MSRVGQAWAKATLGVVGLGVTQLGGPGPALAWQIGGLCLCVGGTLLTTFGVLGLNVPATRRACQLAVLCHALAVYLTSGSALLASAQAVAGLSIIPTQWAMLNLGRLFGYTPLVGGITSAALVLASWPLDPWALSIAPSVLFELFMGPQIARGHTGMYGRAAGMRLRVGEPLPELVLPYRDGSGELDFSQERGHFSLLLFVRGDWCPICHVLMRVVNRERETLARHGVTLHIITRTEGELDPELAEQLGIDVRMLLDRDGAAARALGLLEKDLPDRSVTLPVALLVDGDGILRDITRPEDATDYSGERRIKRHLEAHAAASA